MERNESHVVTKALNLDVDGFRESERSKERYMDFEKDDTAAESATCEMTSYIKDVLG